MLISQQIAEVMHNIENAQQIRRQHNGDSTPVKLVAVTKNHSVEAMQAAIECGITAVGENRIQEALSKQQILCHQVEWHLIGHLQTNKVRQAVGAFQLIHSVDSEKLAVEIDRVAAKKNIRQDVLMQINIGGEETKFGLEPAYFRNFAAFISNLEHVRLCGVMTIAPYYDNVELVRPLFRELYQIYMELKNSQIPNTKVEWLSMGMTNDYKIAIEEGASLIRIGTAIFGSRK